MTKHKVVLIPFPFDDLSATKVRPAVCLTDPIGPHRHVVLAFISSRTAEEGLPTDLLIDSDDADFAETGLRVSSMVHVHRLMTVSTGLILRQLGNLSPHLREEMDKRIGLLFGVDRA